MSRTAQRSAVHFAQSHLLGRGAPLGPPTPELVPDSFTPWTGEWGVSDFHPTFSPHLVEDTLPLYTDLRTLCRVPKCIKIQCKRGEKWGEKWPTPHSPASQQKQVGEGPVPDTGAHRSQTADLIRVPAGTEFGVPKVDPTITYTGSLARDRSDGTTESDKRRR